MSVSVALATLGCKVNQAESEELRQQLEASGCLVTDIGEEAQVYIINTCTVTHVADRKSRNLVQRACRSNPQARVLVTGCYAKRAPLELVASPQVSVVAVGTAEELARHLEGLEPAPGSQSPASATSAARRSRSTIKAQDGCDQFCTFCAVPLARGGSRSLPVDEVVRRVRESVDAGYREVVLTGVNLTYYGQERGGSLEVLIEKVLETGLDRLRLSSLQPRAINAGLLGLWRDSRLCRHFHLALQSGSDSVLRRMGRRYTVEEYRAAMSQIRETVPGASITTDVMVGFPGETQAEFMESYDLCREMGFARMHVFQYSTRPGTAAARLPGAVPAKTRAARSKRMLDLAGGASKAFRETFLGSSMEVLFEEEVTGRTGWWRGYTDNYLEVEVESEIPLADRLLPVTLRALQGEIIIGTVAGGR